MGSLLAELFKCKKGDIFWDMVYVTVWCRAEETSIPAAVSLLPLASSHSSDVLDMPVDPNEPTYCLCHQVSYGEMIGCDNQDVRTPLTYYTFYLLFLFTALPTV